jgi:hypothetical protein
MKTVRRMLIIIVSLLCLPGGAISGEAVKFRPALSVYADDKGIGLLNPEGLACNDKSLFLVGDTGNDRIVRFTVQDKAVTGGKEIRLPQLSKPLRLRLNSKGDIFALDGRERRIVRLDQEGGFKGYLSLEGMPSSSPVVPRSFTIGRDDTLYVLDVFSARVLVLDPAGKYLKHLEFPQEYGFFSDIAVNPRGTVSIIDSINARVYSAAGNATALSPLTASLKEYLSFPVGLTTDSRGTLYIADGNGGSVGMVAPDGAFLGKQLRMGWNEGHLYYPSQICINEKNEMFIADRGNSRVQIFTLIK